MMRRPAHGATRRPPLERPGNGFGRPVRARPSAPLREAATLAKLREWDPVGLLCTPEIVLEPTDVHA